MYDEISQDVIDSMKRKRDTILKMINRRKKLFSLVRGDLPVRKKKKRPLIERIDDRIEKMNNNKEEINEND